MKPNAGAYKPNYSTPPFIIDDHVHARADDLWGKSFLEVYTRHNTMDCYFCGIKDLDRGIAFVKAHPLSVITCATIDTEWSRLLGTMAPVDGWYRQGSHGQI